MKANPFAALNRQPGLLGRAVLPQLLDIPEQKALCQVEGVSACAISKFLAHLCNFGPRQKRMPKCARQNTESQHRKRKEEIEEIMNHFAASIGIRHQLCGFGHRTVGHDKCFVAKALGTPELLALQKNTERSSIAVTLNTAIGSRSLQGFGSSW